MCAPNTQTATLCRCDQGVKLPDQGMEMPTDQGQVTELPTESVLLPYEEVGSFSGSGIPEPDEMQSMSLPCLGKSGRRKYAMPCHTAMCQPQF